jgi:phosphoglycolate phosphatase
MHSSGPRPETHAPKSPSPVPTGRALCYVFAMRQKLVIFDCDGTIVDSQHMIVAAMELAFAEAGLAAPERHDVLSVVGLSLPQAVQQLIPSHEPRIVARIADTYKNAFSGLRQMPEHHDPVYPGMSEAIDALAGRPDVVLGIATGKSRRGVAQMLEREGWHGRFVTIQTADTHPSKPHPSMILTAMTEAGAEPDGTVMIGDTTFDMHMARAADVGALGVAWGYHPVAALAAAGAHAVAADSHGLPTLVTRLLESEDWSV